jgi:hypothetical protein
MRHFARRIAITAAALALLGATGCSSLGQGEGAVKSDQLLAKDCWCSGYNMQPDFFAAVPYRDTLQIRIQRGADLQEISDGLAVLIDDVKAIRPSETSPGMLGKKLSVRLPSSLEPLAMGGNWSLGEGCGADAATGGIEATCDLAPLATAEDGMEEAPLVHMALYLQQSCHNQNIVLHAVSGSILFKSLFSGDPNESVGVDKYTEAIFDVMMGDPQDAAPDAAPGDIPADKLTHLQGCFRFYFERGQPGQPFP